MNSRIIFGFGSLIEEASLRATAPNATDVVPAYIQGFRRDFSLWDPLGYTETNLDRAGIPFCSLDVQKTSESDVRVNGIVFTVGNHDFEQLLKREQEYMLLETIAYDYHTNKPLGSCWVFSACKNNATFDFDSVPQLRYLENYLKAAKQFGNDFYVEILDTTFIDGSPLREFPQLT